MLYLSYERFDGDGIRIMVLLLLIFIQNKP